MVFAAGFLSNCSNGIATALTLYFFGEPLLVKLDRMLKKYGIITEKTRSLERVFFHTRPLIQR